MHQTTEDLELSHAPSLTVDFPLERILREEKFCAIRLTAIAAIKESKTFSPDILLFLGCIGRSSCADEIDSADFSLSRVFSGKVFYPVHVQQTGLSFAFSR